MLFGMGVHNHLYGNAVSNVFRQTVDIDDHNNVRFHCISELQSRQARISVNDNLHGFDHNFCDVFFREAF
jgi:hypothetical protein